MKFNLIDDIEEYCIGFIFTVTLSSVKRNEYKFLLSTLPKMEMRIYLVCWLSVLMNQILRTLLTSLYDNDRTFFTAKVDNVKIKNWEQKTVNCYFNWFSNDFRLYDVSPWPNKFSEILGSKDFKQKKIF